MRSTAKLSKILRRPIFEYKVRTCTFPLATMSIGILNEEFDVLWENLLRAISPQETHPHLQVFTWSCNHLRSAIISFFFPPHILLILNTVKKYTFIMVLHHEVGRGFSRKRTAEVNIVFH